MRKLMLIGGSLLAALVLGGCATPGYSAAERNQMIARSMDYNCKQITDDFDDAFLLRPASGMTIWDVISQN